MNFEKAIEFLEECYPEDPADQDRRNLYLKRLKALPEPSEEQVQAVCNLAELLNTPPQGVLSFKESVAAICAAEEKLLELVQPEAKLLGTEEIIAAHSGNPRFGIARNSQAWLSSGKPSSLAANCLIDGQVGIGDSRTWSPYGLGRRIDAGMRSLISRAHLEVKVLRWGEKVSSSQYGDTDQNVWIELGDEGHPGLPGRYASLVGVLILHRTVGGRAEWRLDEESVMTVYSRNGLEATAAKLCQLPRCWWGPLVRRILAELSAQWLESLPTCAR